jgi:hypothetical protein
MEHAPEIHAHHHPTGHRWVDLILAAAALVLSGVTIVIAFQNEAAMRRLVTANSWPYLHLQQGNASATGEPVIHFDVLSQGVGPATLDKLVVSYAGKPVRNVHELLSRCCGISEPSKTTVGVNVATHYVFAARDQMAFLTVPKTAENAGLWERLSVERFKIDMQACYSSVFDEHWVTSFRKPSPVRVKSCDVLPGPAYDEDLLDSPPGGMPGAPSSN